MSEETIVAPNAKVFVGNLSFKTTDEDLQTLFKECGEIKTAVIIRRGRRSLGYGFIEFATHEDAGKSVSVINGRDFLERTLKVEIARPETEKPRNRLPRGRGPRGRGPRGPRGPKGPKPAATEQPEPTPQPKSDAPVSTAEAENGPGPKRRQQRKRVKKPKATTQPEGKDTIVPAAPSEGLTPGPGPAKPKKRRPKKKAPRAQRPKIPSTTTLFVANLPFSVDDAHLLTIFDGLQPQSAHVVVTRGGRSRGYGFVVFENQEAQLRAMKEKQGTPVPSTTGEPRPIAISISSSGASPSEAATQETPTATSPAVESK